jgi:hypothetical protein
MIKVKTCRIKTVYVDEEADIFLTAYPRDLSPDVAIYSHYGKGPLLTVTIWIDVPRSPRCAFIKDHAENRGILEELIKHRLLEPTGKVAIVGGINFPECKLLLDDYVWAEFDRRFPKPN